MRYLINGDGSVSYQYVSLGPQTIDAVDSLYQLTTEGYWSHIDLRIIWDTRSWENGKYTLTYRVFCRLPIWPWFVEIFPMANMFDHINLVIDNTPVTATINRVMYDPSNPNYGSGTDGEIPECGIIVLQNDTENLRFDITAHHQSGYLRRYVLDALFGKNRFAGVIASETYPGAPRPLWFGAVNVMVESKNAPSLDPWQRCAYQFRLRAWSRITNGFNYIKWDQFSEYYSLDFVGGCVGCGGADLDNSGKVDWGDFAIFASHWLEICVP